MVLIDLVYCHACTCKSNVCFKKYITDSTKKLLHVLAKLPKIVMQAVLLLSGEKRLKFTMGTFLMSSSE